MSTNAQLTFRQNYNLESVATTHHHSTTTTYYDGGVLDIQINGGGFVDILSAGGSFVNGGYIGTLSSATGNPLGGRQAWSGNSGGWITTTVNLPPKAAGQNIQLRWDCATDSGNAVSVTGWYVDTISIEDGYYTCCNDSGEMPVTLNAASISVTPSEFSVTVSSVSGITYALQYKNSLTDPTWTLVPGSVQQRARVVSLPLEDNTPAPTTRFYRAVSY